MSPALSITMARLEVRRVASAELRPWNKHCGLEPGSEEWQRLNTLVSRRLEGSPFSRREGTLITHLVRLHRPCGLFSCEDQHPFPRPASRSSAQTIAAAAQPHCQ